MTPALQLDDGEPDLGPWRDVPDDDLRRRLLELCPESPRPLILVDGRSAGGKTTFATRLGGIVGADVVHTDDIAWQHDFFNWADLLSDNVIGPWREHRDVSYRPPGWLAKGREGSVTCRADRALIIEGVGAARPGLRGLADVVVWCQSDRVEAERRGIIRDIAFGRTEPEAVTFWHEWMSRENPFQEESRPWESASLVVLTTPEHAGVVSDPSSVIVSSRTPAWSPASP